LGSERNGVAWVKSFEVLYGLKKTPVSLGHDKVDGVEVALAGEAASKIGLKFRRRVKATTVRAAEGETGSTHLIWDA
jgi:hypothetical protein